jgi:nickel transport system substrate-binding protein
VKRSGGRFRYALRGLAGVVAATMLVAGCGSSNGEPAETADATAAEEARTTIRIATLEPVGDLNPWEYHGQFHAMDMIYEPLVAYGDGGVLEPALAESWDISEDGLTVTFHLRQNVTFHDGTAFDAEAVKFNLEHWVGQERFRFLRSSEAIIAIDTPDDHTVVLTLSEPYPPLLQELTIVRPVRFMSPAAAPDGVYAEPIGTGPWVFESATETLGVFVRNENYWGTKPELERVELVLIPDSQTRVSALRTGEVDLIGGGYLSPINTVEAADMASDSTLTLLEGDGDTTMSLAFNRNGLLDEYALRYAISLATDVEGLATALYGGPENIAYSYFPPTVPHSGTQFEREYDPELAAQVLDEAGWEVVGETRERDGQVLELELLLVSDPIHGMLDSRVIGQALQDALADINVTVNLKIVDGSAYFDERAEGNYDLLFATTYGAPYDPANSARTFLSSEADNPVWSSPEIDALLDTAVMTDDEQEIAAAYQAVFDILEEEMGYIPIITPPKYYAVRAEVQGFQIPPHEYRLDLTGVTIGG